MVYNVTFKYFETCVMNQVREIMTTRFRIVRMNDRRCRGVHCLSCASGHRLMYVSGNAVLAWLAYSLTFTFTPLLSLLMRSSAVTTYVYCLVPSLYGSRYIVSGVTATIFVGLLRLILSPLANL